MLNVLRCQLTYSGQVVTNAETWFNNSLRPRKPEGSLGRTAQEGHLDSHTAPELCVTTCTAAGEGNMPMPPSLRARCTVRMTHAPEKERKIVFFLLWLQPFSFTLCLLYYIAFVVYSNLCLFPWVTKMKERKKERKAQEF